MRVPQVNERVKEAPAQALRAMFAGIGQLMLFTDRLRNRPGDEAVNQAKGEAPVPAQAPAPESAAAPETVVVKEEAEAPAKAPEAAAAAEPAVAEAPAAEAPAAEAPAPEVPAKEVPAKETLATETPAAELPLPNYDELTVPSLRARMRNLSAEQLNQLVAYEGAHANRADVIGMFERRIAKLAEG